MRIIKRGFIREDKEAPPSENPAPARGARIITITSGKGGVGKTNITVNLAIALAQAGRRVIIFDADLGLANVDVLLGVTPRRTLYDHLYRDVSIENILFPGPGGISIISGGSGFLELANLTAKQRSNLVKNLEKLDRMADIVLIDTGAGISKDVLAFCAAADEVILVITPEPTSLADAYGLIKVLDRFNLHREVHFIVNQVRSCGESNETVYRMNHLVDKYLTIRLNYLGDICYDQTIVSSVKQQSPFILASPTSRAALAVKKIAFSLIDKKWVVEEESGLKGFISKLSRLFR